MSVNAVIYARYSSHSQTEQSIEGQLRACYEFARLNKYVVIGEYIDRALTGKTDNRPAFKRMIEDSKKKQFQFVLVYQLDRFARNRYDSATNKAKLKKNGVRVLSARENITDDASGILVEGVLESMAEYYSAELSQKIKRGLALSAEKCLYTGGGTPALGYKVNPDKTFAIDESAADTVRLIYRMYADGKTFKNITDYLNERKILTAYKKPFNKNSLQHILTNKRYIGIYTFRGKETPNGMPRIVSDELFYEVQRKMAQNKKAPASSRAKEEYILTTRLFCGHCREMMTGTSGTSGTGETYYYYACKNVRSGNCHKKAVRKQYIEDLVVNKCRELLTDERIDEIANKCAEVFEKENTGSEIERLRRKIASVDNAIENLFQAIEAGGNPEAYNKRIDQKYRERAELEKMMSREELNAPKMPTRDEILFFLRDLQKSDFNSLRSRKALIALFVNAIYLYDDKVIFVLTIGGERVEITDKLLNEIETAFSSARNSATPPSQYYTNFYYFIGGFAVMFWL